MDPPPPDTTSKVTKVGCTIQTKDGPICGYIEEDYGRKYYKFKSIPYAKPPIGQLRFLPPQPVTPWTDVLDCSRNSPIPMSIGIDYKPVGTEDCLYLQVSAPNIKPEKPMPVMFWMPGYGFYYLVEEYYDPSLINDQEVVFVQCNARMGPFGFLSINDISAPGNLGLKDLVLGLKWVQQNISAFGGDPNNVTIFGTNSGGAMVHFMMLSPMATGLFHKAIIQNSAALNNWSIDKKPTGAVIQLATKMGIDTTCIVTVVETLKTCSKDDIMWAFTEISKSKIEKCNGIHIDPFFKPCIEEEFEGQQAFLTKSPPTIIKSGCVNKVPVIIGSNNTDSIMFENVLTKLYSFDFKKIDGNLQLMVPKPLAVDDNLIQAIGQKIIKFYSGEDVQHEGNMRRYVQVVIDFFFIYYVIKTVQLHSTFITDCPIYYYVLNHQGEWTIPKDDEHHGEMPFIFRIRKSGFEPGKGSRDSVTTRSRVVKMWTNFAKFSDPTPDENDPLLQIKWDPVESSDKLNYLSIGSELTKGRNPFKDRIEFWDELLEQHPFLKILSFFDDVGYFS